MTPMLHGSLQEQVVGLGVYRYAYEHIAVKLAAQLVDELDSDLRNHYSFSPWKQEQHLLSASASISRQSCWEESSKDRCLQEIRMVTLSEMQ